MKLLSRQHHQVTLAVDGVEAVEKFTAADGDFDVVLMDVHMPRRDGLTATRMIREWEDVNAREPIWIVAMTVRTSFAARAICWPCNCRLLTPAHLFACLSRLESWRMTDSPAARLAAPPSSPSRSQLSRWIRSCKKRWRTAGPPRETKDSPVTRSSNIEARASCYTNSSI